MYIMANLKFKTHTNQDQKQILNQAKILWTHLTTGPTQLFHPRYPCNPQTHNLGGS